MNNVDVSKLYDVFGEWILLFVGNRPYTYAVCKCEIYYKMTKAEFFLVNNDVKDYEMDDEFPFPKDVIKAAVELRNFILQSTGNRIWGLLFTLYPDGRFEIEYDYNKPEGYEETDELITGDEINQSLGGLS